MVFFKEKLKENRSRIDFNSKIELCRQYLWTYFLEQAKKGTCYSEVKTVSNHDVYRESQVGLTSFLLIKSALTNMEYGSLGNLFTRQRNNNWNWAVSEPVYSYMLKMKNK